MPLTLDTTIGGASANTYVTLQEAIDYFDARLNSNGWLNVGEDKQTQALLMAAQRLDRENWLGNRVTTTQRLAWPRFEVSKVDQVSLGYGFAGYYSGWGWEYGETYPTTEIPQPVKDAQCELAIAYLDGYPGTSVKELKQGGVTVDIEHPALPGDLPPRVMQLIAGLISGNKLIRG